ncbi:MAG: DUF2249 domain-containing protein [Planctomycetota bacterium]
MPIAVTGASKLSKALQLHDDVLEYVIALNPHDFARLRNPLMRRLMPPRISLARIAKMTAAPDLLIRIHEIAGITLTSAERAELHADTDIGDPEPHTPLPDWVTESPAQTVDLLDSDERLDADPMNPIMRAMKTAEPGEVVLIKHKWEPQPLYDIWDKIGVAHCATQVGPEEWWVYIRRES